MNEEGIDKLFYQAARNMPAIRAVLRFENKGTRCFEFYVEEALRDIVTQLVPEWEKDFKREFPNVDLKFKIESIRNYAIAKAAHPKDHVLYECPHTQQETSVLERRVYRPLRKQQESGL